ncbi:MAG: MFS transporter, partial [Pirellulales bacterium]
MQPRGERVRSGSGRTRVRVGVMALLCGLSFLTYYDRQCIVRAQEGIQQALAIDDVQMGLVFGAFWLAYALFEIPGGWMGERFGARLTLTRIVLAWSVFTVLTGAAAGFYSLLVYRFLFGVGEAGAYPNMAHIQSRWLPGSERARAGGALWLCARWGAAFAPLIFGTLTRS